MNEIAARAPGQTTTAGAATEPACWQELLRAWGTVSVELAITGFAVRDLYRITPGTLVETAVLEAAAVPVRVNGQLIAFGEFQLVGDRLAVRIAEIA